MIRIVLILLIAILALGAVWLAYDIATTGEFEPTTLAGLAVSALLLGIVIRRRGGLK